MKRTHMPVAIAAMLLLFGCTPIAGPVFAKTSVRKPVFDATGLRLHVTVECQYATSEHKPTTYTPTECPAQPIPGDISLRTPWGQMYRGSVFFAAAAQSPGPVEQGGAASATQPTSSAQPRRTVAGILAVEIDWKMSGVDPPGVLDAAKLGSGWLVFSKDGKVNASLILSNDEVRSMLAVIGASPAGDDDVGRPADHAELTAKLSNDLDPTGINRMILSITNHGPDPAYKVGAQVRSSATAIHGARLFLGRINRGETKSRFLPISITNDSDDLNPMVFATVTSLNAPPSNASGRLRLTSVKHPRVVPLQLSLSCAPFDTERVPGQRLRVECEATNLGDVPIRGVSFQAAVGKLAATPIVGPAEFAPRGHVKFEFAPTLPASVPAGLPVPITIAINAPDSIPVQQQIAVWLSEPNAMCKQGKFTRDEYRSKRKKLQGTLIAKMITQEDFDKYDAEYVSCLEVGP